MKNVIIDFSKNLSDLVLKEDSCVYGLLIPEENGIYKNKFNILFKKSGIIAKFLIKIVLLGSGEVEFEPNIIIEKILKDVNCELEIKCLTNTDSSKLKVTPSMEVSNPNVRVRHSLTISTFDDNQLNYLSSRGLGKTNARKLLIDAFVDDIIKKIEQE